MLPLVQFVSVLLVAVAMAMALAHALEYPGKLRLSKDAYIATQPIYYPGFTIGGAVGEFGGILVTLALLLLTPFGLDFFLVLGAVAGLIAMQAVYWTVTHPVNSFWLKDTEARKRRIGLLWVRSTRRQNRKQTRRVDGPARSVGVFAYHPRGARLGEPGAAHGLARRLSLTLRARA